jgi:hypothetical protein
MNVGSNFTRDFSTITQSKMCGRVHVVLFETRRSRLEPRDLDDLGAPLTPKPVRADAGLSGTIVPY